MHLPQKYWTDLHFDQLGHVNNNPTLITQVFDSSHTIDKGEAQISSNELPRGKRVYLIA